MPRASILAPQRRSMVSSMPTTTGPSGTRAATSTRSRRWATARADQRAALRVDGEAGRPLQARDAQGGGDGAPSRRQQGAGGQDQHVAPDRGGEAGRERAWPVGQPLGSVKRHRLRPPPPPLLSAGRDPPPRGG